MSESLKTWVGLIIAVFAALQPWLMIVWEKFIRRQDVEAYGAGNMEIGFGSVGPTVGLQGTIRAVNRDVFVKSITLKVTRHKDKAEHQFMWGVFRAPGFANPQDAATELCSSFLLSENAPRRVNIVFWEPVAFEEIRPKVERIRQAWFEEVRNSPAQAYFEQNPPGQPLPTDLHQFLRHLYDKQFRSSDLHVSTFAELSRVFYWEAGSYHCDLVITTARPDRSYPTSWSFELTTENADLLRANVIKAIMEACAQPTGGFNFVFPSYLQAVGA